MSVKGEEKHSSSWVVDVEKMLADDDPHWRRMEAQRWEAQSIYRVPEWLKGTSSKAYRPQLVSLGPFHHGDPNLQSMEEHKRRALVHLIKRSKKLLKDFISAIDDVAEELQAAYGMDLHVKWRNNRRSFVEMMLMDGCFLLEMMSGPFRDYELHDPVFSRSRRKCMYSIIRSDMLLLENQLPLLLLKKILGVVPPAFREVTESRHEVKMDRKINRMVLRFLGRAHEGHGITNTSLGLHPLELYHGSLTYKECAHEAPKESRECKYETMPSALEMHEAGIKFRKSERDNLLDIDFKGGVLTMPVVKVDDGTKSLYLNLMAFERLRFGVGGLVTAYVFFMEEMLILAEDVAILSSNGLLQNKLCCDKETAKLFNYTLSRGQVLGRCYGLHNVQYEVDAYCRKPWHMWLATLRTYFRNPWAFISDVEAAIAPLLQIIYPTCPISLN